MKTNKSNKSVVKSTSVTKTTKSAKSYRVIKLSTKLRNYILEHRDTIDKIGDAIGDNVVINKIDKDIKSLSSMTDSKMNSTVKPKIASALGKIADVATVLKLKLS